MNADRLLLAGNGQRLVNEYLNRNDLTMPSLKTAMDIRSLATLIIFTNQSVGIKQADAEDILVTAYMMGKADGLAEKKA